MLNVGDMIIDFDQIHVVAKIENDRVFYYPLTEDGNKGKIVSSIPLNNFKKASIRPLFTKTEAKDFLKSLAKLKSLEITSPTYKNNNNSLKEYLYLNDPVVTGQLLIYLTDRQKTSIYSKSDQIIFDQALNHLASEIAAASKITLDSAKKQILTAIKRKK